MQLVQACLEEAGSIPVLLEEDRFQIPEDFLPSLQGRVVRATFSEVVSSLDHLRDVIFREIAQQDHIFQANMETPPIDHSFVCSNGIAYEIRGGVLYEHRHNGYHIKYYLSSEDRLLPTEFQLASSHHGPRTLEEVFCDVLRTKVVLRRLPALQFRTSGGPNSYKVVPSEPISVTFLDQNYQGCSGS